LEKSKIKENLMATEDKVYQAIRRDGHVVVKVTTRPHDPKGKIKREIHYLPSTVLPKGEEYENPEDDPVLAFRVLREMIRQDRIKKDCAGVDKESETQP